MISILKMIGLLQKQSQERSLDTMFTTGKHYCLRLLADYDAALANEIAVDAMQSAVAGTFYERIRIPRVAIWLPLANRHKVLFLIASYAARLMWIMGGALAFFLLEFFRHLPICIFDKGEKLTRLHGGAVLGFSTRALDIAVNHRELGFPRQWLVFPWVETVAGAEDFEVISLARLINLRDLFLSFSLAMVSVYDTRHSRSGLEWSLQKYTAFKWFLARIAVDRVDGTLVTAEHYDRWAILADRSVFSCRNVDGTERSLVVIQHGTLGEVSGTAYSLSIPTRLRCVDIAYVYNEAEREHFLGRLVCDNSKCIPRFIIFSTKFTIANIPKSDVPTFLFVGHPLCESFQVSLYRQLILNTECVVYYKPHPKAKAGAVVSNLPWHFIEDPSFFPRVNALITYPSTLVVEYGSQGISSMVHPIDAAPGNEEYWIGEIRKILDF